MSHNFSGHNDVISTINSLNSGNTSKVRSTSHVFSEQNGLVIATSNFVNSVNSGTASQSPYHHHHCYHSGIKAISQSPLFHVHQSSQLKIIIPPISPLSHSLSTNSIENQTITLVHPMVTRLRKETLCCFPGYFS